MTTTATRTMDRLLFGDNQFFGVNHMSEEKARAQQMRFQDVDSIMQVLDYAYDDGVTTFMCTTHDRIEQVCDHVRQRYNAEPGFITMNLPRVLDDLDRAGVENPIVCSNINKLGFRMSGGVEGYLDAMDKRPFRAVAMSVFASGAVPPREAIEWVCGLPNLESIVFGASSRANIASTVSLVDEYWQAD
jgi:hypothetical protein